MKISMKPITKKELIRCFLVYRQAFPEWIVENDVVLTRTEGVVKQYMAFESLRNGMYRPSCSVGILLTPDVRVLTCYLDPRHREVGLRDHDLKWKSIIDAIEIQFKPAVRGPLSASNVLKLAEEEVVRDNIGNVKYISGLAALCKHLGDNARSLYWCNRAKLWMGEQGRIPYDWEVDALNFIDNLEKNQMG